MCVYSFVFVSLFQEAIAYFPLIVLFCGVVTSSLMQKITKKIGYQVNIQQEP